MILYLFVIFFVILNKYTYSIGFYDLIVEWQKIEEDLQYLSFKMK